MEVSLYVGFQSLRVGSIGTPVGSITLSAAYRTKLTLPERLVDDKFI